MPFGGENTLAIMHAQVYDPPPQPSALNPRLGPAVDAAILKALAKRPEDRFQSGVEMVAALRRAMASPQAEPATVMEPLPLRQVHPEQGRRAQDTIARMEIPGQRVALRPVRKRKRVPWLPWGVVLIGVLAMCGILTALLTGGQLRPEPSYTSVPTDTPEPSTPTDTLLVRETPTATDTPVSPTATPMMTSTPPPQAAIGFHVDRDHINAGECVTLSWDIENVKEVYVDAQPQTGHGSKVLCPCSNETHTLRVVHTDGSEETRTVTISVSGVCPPSSCVSEPAESIPKFMDIREACIWQENEQLVFMIRLGAPPPDSLKKHIGYVWALDLDQSASTGQRNGSIGSEYHVRVAYAPHLSHTAHWGWYGAVNAMVPDRASKSPLDSFQFEEERLEFRVPLSVCAGLADSL